MKLTMTEKILAIHSGKKDIKPGDIVDVEIDARVARDFGGPNVVKNIKDNNLGIADPSQTFFTFDTNPTGSDQKYATNQQICRTFARDHGIRIFDINSGIGTHILIEEGIVYPGTTAISTDSHANILGAVGAFGQGMGDKDIAAAWSTGKVWFKVPPAVQLNLKGDFPGGISAKDVVLNLLSEFGANTLLGHSVEMSGKAIDSLSLDDRITISSMATEMGAINIIFPPGEKIIKYCIERSGKDPLVTGPDKDAKYEKVIDIDVSKFIIRVSRPGKPHDTVDITDIGKTKIDSAFIGSCTNGRIEDMRVAANILNNRKIAPGVVLKIVPSTNKVWDQCLDEGIIRIFKKAGALVSNAGCAGCAAGQVGQNGPGEITVSTGNRNFPGKQGKGEVYLASPAVVAASAVSGYITTADKIPDEPLIFKPSGKSERIKEAQKKGKKQVVNKPTTVEGRVWIIDSDNIDTDMIFHNKYLTITDFNEMGKYTFDNLSGYEDFAGKAKKGDIVITGKNFGSGSSRQQAVDCFKSLGVQLVLAQSFGAIYERNAVNAAFPIMTYETLDELEIKNGDKIQVSFANGEIKNKKNSKSVKTDPFSDVQMEIYQNGGLF